MIYLILILGLILRLVSLNQSLWLDEAINVVNAKNLGLLTFITKYPIGDFHPPGYFLLLWLWSHLMGFSEIMVRIPSVIFGLLTIWLTYLIGKKLFSENVGILSGLLLASAPLHVYYSQEARMYSLAALAVTLNVYFFLKLLKKESNSKIYYVVSAALVIYSDYLAYLIFPTQLIYLFLFEKSKLVNFLKVFLVPFAAFIIWLPIFYEQLMNGLKTAYLVPGWADVVGGVSIKNLGLIFAKIVVGRVSFDDKILYTLLILIAGLIYGGIIVKSLRKNNGHIKLFILWIIVPVILAIVISFFVPVLSYFRLLFILPAIYLLLATGVESLSKQLKKLTILVLIFISGSCLYLYYTTYEFQREDWRRAVLMIENLARETQATLVFESNGNLAPFEYYTSGQKWLPGLKRLPAQSENDVTKFEDSVKNVYLFEYLVDITDPQKLLPQSLEKDGFMKKEIYNFTGVGLVTSYTRF